jgi:hypothetical protein
MDTELDYGEIEPEASIVRICIVDPDPDNRRRGKIANLGFFL